tara:strand:- start:1114 stop:1332 length:219 start_codon:yes stop_codon:yes gene_type:complete
MLNSLLVKRDNIINKKVLFEIKLKELNKELEILENAINKLCCHNWVIDYIDKPNGEGSEKITYCDCCYLNKN